MVTPFGPIVRAVFDEEGRPHGFYPEPMWTADKAPSTAIEIPIAAYIEFLEFQGRRRWDGTKIIPCEPAPGRPAPEMHAIMAKLEGETKAMHEAIVFAVTSWAGVENSLAHLMDALIPASGIGMAIYYTPTGTETRINIVNTCVLHICSQIAIGSRIAPLWRRLHKRISSAKNTRNSIVHGNVVTHNINNKQSVRLTRPIFDLSPGNKDKEAAMENARKQMAGDARLQFLGRSANDVRIAAQNFGELSELCRMLRWPFLITRTPEPWPPSLHETLQQLEARLLIPHDPPTDDQTHPERPPPHGS